ncbi:MAG: Crp/Fnr family transcriptional regulator [Pseudomonadota bacterium]
MTGLQANNELVSRLFESDFFSGLNQPTVERIASVARRVSFEAGHTLFLQDDPGDALYVILQGSIEISVMAADGKKLSLNIMRSGDVFGEIAVLDGGKRTATATVLDPVVLLRITQTDVKALMNRHSELAADLIAMLCKRLRWVSQITEDLGLLCIERRLASRLVVLDKKFPDSQNGLPLSQGEMADFLGATRESINKTLRAWQEEGIIGLSRGSIRILNRARLRDLSATHH